MKITSKLLSTLIAGAIMSTSVQAAPWFNQSDFNQKAASANDRVLAKIINNKANRSYQLVELEQNDISSEVQSIMINIRGVNYTLEQTKFDQKGSGSKKP